MTPATLPPGHSAAAGQPEEELRDPAPGRRAGTGWVVLTGVVAGVAAAVAMALWLMFCAVLWGPYETYLSTNAAQPDYYLGWLIGGLRLMPPFEVVLGDYTVVPNPFWFGAGFPMFVFLVLYLLPLIDKKLFGDRRGHELLDRPRDNPRRSAALVAFLGWVALVTIGGATDRVFFRLDVSYEAQIWLFRILVVAFPPIAYFIAKRYFQDLQARDPHPQRGWTGRVVRRTDEGGFELLDSTDGAGLAEAEPDEGQGKSPTPTGS